MDVPPSPDRVFDFPVAEPEPKPVPEQAPVEMPVNMNGWIEWDVPLLGEMDVPMENPGGGQDADMDMLMDGDEADEDDEDEDDNEDDWDVDEEWLIASVKLPPMPVVPPPSVFEVCGPSTAAPGLPFPMGLSLPEVVRSVVVHHVDIGGLCIRTENLEHAHGVLQEQVMTKVGEVEDQVLEMQNNLNNYPSEQELRKENQKLRELLRARKGDQGMLASYVLGLGERLAMVELQFPRLPPGPQ
ncbi:hypothetical protein Tco_0986846 [Tanacetum coccineum]